MQPGAVILFPPEKRGGEKRGFFKGFIKLLLAPSRFGLGYFDFIADRGRGTTGTLYKRKFLRNGPTGRNPFSRGFFYPAIILVVCGSGDRFCIHGDSRTKVWVLVVFPLATALESFRAKSKDRWLFFGLEVAGPCDVEPGTGRHALTPGILEGSTYVASRRHFARFSGCCQGLFWRLKDQKTHTAALILYGRIQAASSQQPRPSKSGREGPN